MTIEQPLFKKKNVIHVINEFCKPGTEETEIMEKKLLEFIRKNNKNDSLDNNSPEYEILINRIHNFLESTYNYTQEYERISDKQYNDQLETLKKIMKRESFSPRDTRAKDDFERSLYITRLYMKNWMMFEDKEIIFDSPLAADEIQAIKNSNDIKNIIVFHGENTTGKSNIFKAIKMAILGQKKYISSQELVKKQNKDDFLKDHLSRRAIEKAIRENITNISMEIVLDFEIKNKIESSKIDRYSVVRKWNADISGALEMPNITIYENENYIVRKEIYGETNKKEGDELDEYLQRFIPETLQMLFITDKEILGRKIIEDQDKFIQGVVRKASEYEAFDDMFQRLKNLYDKHKKTTNEIIMKKLTGKEKKADTLSKQSKDLERENESIKKKIEKLEEKKKENENFIEKNEAKTRSYNDDELQRFNSLKREIGETEKDIKKIEKSMNDLISKNYIDISTKLLFTDELFARKLKEAKSQLKKVPKASIYADFDNFNDILKRMRDTSSCVCGREVTEEVNNLINEQLKRTLYDDQNKIYNYLLENFETDSDPNYLEKDHEIKLLNNNLIELMKNKNELTRQIDSIDISHINKDCKETLNKINDFRAKNQAIDDDIQSHERNIEMNEQKIRDLDAEFEALSEEIKDPKIIEEKDTYKQQLEFLSLCMDMNKVLQKRFDVILTEHVAKMMTEYFQKIDWEAKFWQGFKIDENWQLFFINELGQPISLASDAQKKIIMISFICALIDVRKIKIPWIIDNVLSELSGENITGFAKHACGNISFPQQFFFFTEDEWIRIQPELAGKILKEFTTNKLSSIETELIEVEIK